MPPRKRPLDSENRSHSNRQKLLKLENAKIQEWRENWDSQTVVNEGPLRQMLAEITAKKGIGKVTDDAVLCMALGIQKRLENIVTHLIRLSKLRGDCSKPASDNITVTSDVISQVREIRKIGWEELKKKREQEARERKEKEQAEKEKLAENPEEKLNLCERMGGDDMLSQWLSMSQIAKPSMPDKLKSADNKNKTLPPAARTRVKNNQRNVRSNAASSSGTITVRDIIAYLERDPNMSKSNFLYRLYERSKHRMKNSQVGRL